MTTECLMQVAPGRAVDPFNLKPRDLDLGDIVRALAFEARFGGHAGEWRVAQHTMCVFSMVEAAGGSNRELRAALGHDFSEAYLKDIPKPIKMRPEFAEYREAEERAMRVISGVFQFAWPLPPLVKEMDAVCTYLEAEKRLERLHECWVDWKPPIPEKYREWFVAAYRLAEDRQVCFRGRDESWGTLVFGVFGGGYGLGLKEQREVADVKAAE